MFSDWENYYLLVAIAAGSSTGFLVDHATQEEVFDFVHKNHGKVKTIYNVQILTEEAFEMLASTFRGRECLIEGAQ